MSVGTTLRSGHSARKISIPLFLLFFSILSQFAFSELLSKKDKEFLSTDFRVSYHPTAINIIDGKDIFTAFYMSEHSTDPKKAHKKLNLNHPPGYPVFIALNYKLADILDFERLVFLKIVETIIYGLSALVLFLILNLFFSYYDSVFGTMLWIINPLNLWLTRQPHSEIPFYLFFFLSLFFFFRMRAKKSSFYLILFSIGVAITIYLRSAAIFLPIVCLLVALYSSTVSEPRTYSFTQKLGIIILPYLLIAPWITFISVEQKSFIPMTTSGQIMMYNGLTYVVKKGDSEFIEAPLEVRSLIARISDNLNAKSFDEKRIGVKTIIIQNLINDPYASMKLIFIKFIKSTHATFSKRDETKIFIFNLVFFVLVSYGLFSTQKNTYSKLSILFALYSFALCILTFPLIRYMLPALGLFSVYVSISVRRIFFVLTKLALKS